MPHIGIFGLLLLASLCTIPARASTDPANPSPPVDPARARYIEQLDKSEQEREETHKKNMELLEKTAQGQDETQRRNLEFLDRDTELLERTEKLEQRQEADFSRFEKILDTWERQQVEYQKYLDQLQKK